jgi:uncharacterized protein YejL (UPF0352 family)
MHEALAKAQRVGEKAHEDVGEAVGEALREALRKALCKALCKALHETVCEALHEALPKAPREVLRKALGEALLNSCATQMPSFPGAALLTSRKVADRGLQANHPRQKFLDIRVILGLWLVFAPSMLGRAVEQ